MFAIVKFDCDKSLDVIDMANIEPVGDDILSENSKCKATWGRKKYAAVIVKCLGRLFTYYNGDCNCEANF